MIALDLDHIPGPQIAAALGITPERVRHLRKKGRTKLTEQLTELADREGGNHR